jgi:hypothetical protein
LKYKPALDLYGIKVGPQLPHWFFQYKPSHFAHNFLIVVMLFLAIFEMLFSEPSEFLYYNF